MYPLVTSFNPVVMQTLTKRLHPIFWLFSSFLATIIHAQAPQGLHYQTVIRHQNQLISNQALQVGFTIRDDVQGILYRENAPGVGPSIGLFAQEAEPLFPELVSEKEGIKTLIYDGFTVRATRAIQEQQFMIEQQQRLTHDRSASVRM
jgi:hypothetical protein